jgi:F0F1-type ATP synthase assembly protein I
MVEYKRKIRRTYIDKDLNLKETIEIKKEHHNKNLGSYQYLNIGFYLITPLLVGIFSGLYLDKRIGTHSIFITIGLLVGVIGTFYNLYRLTK